MGINGLSLYRAKRIYEGKKYEEEMKRKHKKIEPKNYFLILPGLFFVILGFSIFFKDIFPNLTDIWIIILGLACILIGFALVKKGYGDEKIPM